MCNEELVECLKCVCVLLGVVGEGDERIGFGFGLYQSCGNRGSVGVGCVWVAAVWVV